MTEKNRQELIRGIANIISNLIMTYFTIKGNFKVLEGLCTRKEATERVNKQMKFIPKKIIEMVANRVYNN